MPQVISVKFKNNSKPYFFAPGELIISEGDGVIVETARGVEYGVAVSAAREIDDKRVVQPLKPVIRIATAEDLQQVEKNEAKKDDALRVAAEKVKKHNLDMKLTDAEFTFDTQKVIFYFTADGRVDFRELVRDLASHFRIRIELRQIGIRDECRMLGGIAPCGRVCCCASHLADFERVSIKMAKNQGLSLNSQKISGLCGRLMCCLAYENGHYCETAKRMPKVNSEVTTPDGTGTVLSNNVLKETVRVRVYKNADSFDINEYSAKDLKWRGATMSEDFDKEVAVDDSIKELLD
jgi:cell fate regulator YaaT (PSP1 superfamily)